MNLQQLMNFYASHGNSIQAILITETLAVWTAVTAIILFIPTYIALYRRHSMSSYIFALNIIGAVILPFIGFVASLAWAVSDLGNEENIIKKEISPVQHDILVNPIFQNSSYRVHEPNINAPAIDENFNPHTAGTLTETGRNSTY